MTPLDAETREDLRTLHARDAEEVGKDPLSGQSVDAMEALREAVEKHLPALLADSESCGVLEKLNDLLRKLSCAQDALLGAFQSGEQIPRALRDAVTARSLELSAALADKKEAQA